MPFGPLKLLAMVEPVLALAFRQKELKTIPAYDARKLNNDGCALLAAGESEQALHKLARGLDIMILKKQKIERFPRFYLFH